MFFGKGDIRILILSVKSYNNWKRIENYKNRVQYKEKFEKCL